MSWNLKGRNATAVFDPATQYKILHSEQMMRCANKPLLWIVEELTNVDVIACLSGPLGKIEYFVCLIMRLLQITPLPSIVMRMLQQDVHKYMRVAALLIIRLIGNNEMRKHAIEIGWNDYRKIRVYGNKFNNIGSQREYCYIDDNNINDNVKEEEEEEENVVRGKRKRHGDENIISNIQKSISVKYRKSEENNVFESMDMEQKSENKTTYFICRIDELVDELYNVPTSTQITSRVNECCEKASKLLHKRCDVNSNTNNAEPDFELRSNNNISEVVDKTVFLGISLTRLF